jgi:hypothetical protein
MEKTGAELMFGWVEDVWTQGNEAPGMNWSGDSYIISEGGTTVPLSSEEFRRAHRHLKEGLTDIRLGFESFAISGDHVTCAMVVKARNKFSGEPIALHSKFDGRVRDGQLVSAANAIDYRLV